MSVYITLNVTQYFTMLFFRQIRKTYSSEYLQMVHTCARPLLVFLPQPIYSSLSLRPSASRQLAYIRWQEKLDIWGGGIRVWRGGWWSCDIIPESSFQSFQIMCLFSQARWLVPQGLVLETVVSGTHMICVFFLNDSLKSTKLPNIFFLSLNVIALYINTPHFKNFSLIDT